MERVQELAGLFGTFLNADGAWRMSFHRAGQAAYLLIERCGTR